MMSIVEDNIDANGIVRVDLDNFSGLSRDINQYSIHGGGQALGFNAPQE